MDAQRHAWRVFADASGAATPGQVTAALVGAYTALHVAGRPADAGVLLAALRRHGRHVGAMRARTALDAAEVRVYGPAQALVRQVARRQRARDARAVARLAELEQRVFGEPVATFRALWRARRPGQPYPAALRAQAAPRAGGAR